MAEWVTIGSSSAVPEGEVMSFGAQGVKVFSKHNP